jgi:plastocyanin
MANSLSLSDNGDGTWSVGYETSEAIGGFQFTVDGATINSASGGDAASNGFMTSASGSTVLGFSLTGGTIAVGNGNLIDLDLSGDPTGLSSLVVSNAAGQDLGFTFDGGDAEADYIVEVGGDGNSFSPANLQIEAGETVQWVNISGFHNVDGSTDTYPNNPDSFYSGDPSNDAWTYSFTFEIEGVYDYDCSPHASMGMVGTITVGDGDPLECILDCDMESFFAFR